MEKCKEDVAGFTLEIIVFPGISQEGQTAFLTQCMHVGSRKTMVRNERPRTKAGLKKGQKSHSLKLECHLGPEESFGHKGQEKIMTIRNTENIFNHSTNRHYVAITCNTVLLSGSL